MTIQAGIMSLAMTLTASIYWIVAEMSHRVFRMSLLAQNAAVGDFSWLVKMLEIWGPAAVLLIAIYKLCSWLGKRLFDEPDGLIVKWVSRQVAFIDSSSKRMEKIEENLDSIQRTQARQIEVTSDIVKTQEKLLEAHNELMRVTLIKVDKLEVIELNDKKVLEEIAHVKTKLLGHDKQMG